MTTKATNTEVSTQATTVLIKPKKAEEWVEHAKESGVLTINQQILNAFMALSAADFIVVEKPELSPNGKPLDLDTFLQNVSVYMTKNGYNRDKKECRKDGLNPNSIVIRRLA